MATISETDTKSSSLKSEKVVELLPSEDNGTSSEQEEENSPRDDGPKGGARAWLYVLAAFFIFINAW
ncbi:hypothetical protein O1611_g6197 [Lasiodiplodia mahajangana]|uniref:Uncharacterized protein n=1 Tax=Lasiodiplodia mahajangana TaxID=1108764 RepID=A0ACC2JJH3_9PEZI|nr:hypothetical protein O1611_g6197 [Lasiodiplodia mahajangana]